VRLGPVICLFGSVAAWPIAAHAQSTAQPTTATSPKIEMVRVKPIDPAATKPRLQLSDSSVDLMNGFSLDGSQGIGATWKMPPIGEAFDARYGQW
jgi:hypothetical protein